MYKDILVHVDESPACARRLDMGVALARRFGGRLKAVFAQTDSDRAGMVARRRGTALERAAAETKAAVAARAAAEGVALLWLETSSGHPEDVVRETVVAARFADIAVMSPPDPEHGQRHGADSLVEDVVLHSGRPVLVVPQAGWAGTLATRVLVAWNASRESARALGDALPLLSGSREVLVLSRRPPEDADRDAAASPWPGIVEHLNSHGIAATKADWAVDGIGVMDLLLAQAEEHGSDLIVMGAHGDHESLFARRGVGTRFILRHATVPILLTH